MRSLLTLLLLIVLTAVFFRQLEKVNFVSSIAALCGIIYVYNLFLAEEC
jgi:hypothetical protein